jgi:diaminopimelate epimerase
MKNFLITTIVSLMLASNVNAGTDGENNISKKAKPVKDCFENDLKILGPKIENNELFPEKINVTFAQVDDKNNITVNVWERGAGLTKACGTAACATGVAAAIKKLTENDVSIKFKEGALNIKIDKDLNIFMRGPVSDIKYTKLEI